MKNTAQYIIFFILFSFTIPVVCIAFANTSVEISGNGEGSSASVNIKQHVNSSSTNQNSSSSISGHTKVVVNGETIIDSNKPENVNYESKDGNVKVDINTSVNQGSNHAADITITPNPTITQKIEEIKNKLEEKKEEIKKKVEKIKEHKPSPVKKNVKSEFFVFKIFDLSFFEKVGKFIFR